MNLITSFITHSVQPGTSFAATPTLTLFKELYIIAARLVATVPPKPSQKMKRPPESDVPAQLDSISSSTERLVPNTSFSSHLSTQTSTSFVSTQFHLHLPKHNLGEFPSKEV